MHAVIDSILSENTAYYRRLKQELVGRLLVNEKGTLFQKTIKGSKYLYIRKKGRSKDVDRYLAPVSTEKAYFYQGLVEQRKKDIQALRQTKYALNRLRDRSMHHEDYPSIVKELFQLMDKEGLWVECLELIGSWCFKIYQNHFGVEYYPERTIDVDFAVSIPYTGSPVKIGAKLQELGFQEEINRFDESIVYRSGEIKVEFFRERTGNGSRQGKPYVPELDIAPQALPYLKILLNRPFTVSIRDLGKVTIPSMPAFLVHKLIIADERRDQGKKTKDYRQTVAVAKAVARDEDLFEEAQAILSGLHKKQRQKVKASCRRAEEYIPGSSGWLVKVLS